MTDPLRVAALFPNLTRPAVWGEPSMSFTYVGAYHLRVFIAVVV
jgi:hypothetical protein